MIRCLELKRLEYESGISLFMKRFACCLPPSNRKSRNALLSSVAIDKNVLQERKVFGEECVQSQS